jgi:phosphoribosylglycinamide formyltransferase-1
MICLGIIGSGGGSALAAANLCLRKANKKVRWVVITDRACGLATWAESNDYPVHHIEYKNTENFSSASLKIFQQEKCESVLLFYTRKVSSPLIDYLRVYNIHPSLLPAHRGLHAVEQAYASRVSLLGATLHHADEDLDSGEIVAQIVSPLCSDIPISFAKHISYIQKVWLTLTWFEYQTEKRLPRTYSQWDGFLACPGLASQDLQESFMQWHFENSDMNALNP